MHVFLEHVVYTIFRSTFVLHKYFSMSYLKTPFSMSPKLAPIYTVKYWYGPLDTLDDSNFFSIMKTN